MAWRFSHWTEGHYSQVALKLKDADGAVKLSMEHKDVPIEDLERCKEGWRNLQFNRMKTVLGFGSSFGGFM